MALTYAYLILESKAELSDLNQLGHIHSGDSEAPEQLGYYQGSAVEPGECIMLE